MRWVILLFLALGFGDVFGQEIQWRSAQQLGAGYICSLPAVGDVASFNPSVHADQPGLSGGVHYTMPFQMASFAQQFAHLVYGAKFGYVGLGLGSNGDSNSALRRVGLQYSRGFGGKWRAGLGYYYLSHHFSTQQNFNASFSVAGLSYHAANDEWVVSVAVQNMEQQTIAYPGFEGKIPSVVVTGVQWQPAEGLFLLTEVEKDFDRQPDFKGAVIYHFKKLVRLSVGASGADLSLTAGAGVVYRGVQLHVGMAHHRDLGLSTAASLSVFGLFGKSYP